MARSETSPSRVVVDTNVLVSRALTPTGPPARVVDLVLTGQVVACYDRRIVAEYRAVLLRPRFGFDHAAVDSLLALIAHEGLSVIPPPVPLDLPDESDRPFAEVALATGAWLVTGNLKHFPGLDRAVSPADFLRLDQAERRRLSCHYPAVTFPGPGRSSQ